ncbi:MAG: helix-turn-helix domain-containing protein [Clostridiaceae bacterium]
MNKAYRYRLYPDKEQSENNQKGTIRIIDNSHIRIPKLKNVKIKLHREISSDYDIKSATISQPYMLG